MTMADENEIYRMGSGIEVGSYCSEPISYDISVCADNVPYATLHPNGDVTFGEGITPTEAARTFWDAVRFMLNEQPFVLAERERCAKIAEGYIRGGNEESLARAIAAAIRAATLKDLNNA